MDDLASRLLDGAESRALSCGRRRPEFLLKFAPRHIDGGFFLGELTLRYRPHTLIAFLPEGTAWMDQEHLEFAVLLPIENQAGALGGTQRLSGSRVMPRGARERLLAGADRDFEPVLWRRHGTAPGWVVCAIRVVGVVEVDGDVVAVGVHLQVAARGIGLVPRCGVSKWDEELVRVV